MGPEVLAGLDGVKKSVHVEKSQKIYKNCSKNLLTLAFFRDIIEVASE